jgi:hypothetical protein
MQYDYPEYPQLYPRMIPCFRAGLLFMTPEEGVLAGTEAVAMGREDAYFTSATSTKIEVHGAVPEEVDYNGPGQSQHFEQLVKVIDASDPARSLISVVATGLLSFLQKRAGHSGITAMTCWKTSGAGMPDT